MAETSYGYTGEWTDGMGLVNLRARYYSPTQGRFVSQDTWKGNDQNPITINQYLYVLNNPLRFIDPTGKVPIIDDDNEGHPIVDEDYEIGPNLYPHYTFTERGQRLYNLYNKLNAWPGWWNNWNPGSMSEATFIGIHHLWEISGVQKVADRIYNCTKNQVWMSGTGSAHDNFRCSGRDTDRCYIQVFNFLAVQGGEYSYRRLDIDFEETPWPRCGIEMSCPPTVSTGTGIDIMNFLTEAEEIGNYIMTYEAEKVPYNENALWNYGNFLPVDDLKNKAKFYALTMNGSGFANNQVEFSDESGLLVFFTYLQYMNYLTSGE